MNPHPMRWEYRVELDLDISRLEVLGSEGWELVAVVPGAASLSYYFKRPALDFREVVTLDQKRRYYAEWKIGETE